MFQVSHNHNIQQMIQHTWIVNFIHYACPLASTTTSLSIYINKQPNTCDIMFRKRLRVHLRGWEGSNPAAISCSWNPKKVFFRNTQLLQGLDIVGTHVKHGGNKYQSCIVAGINNLLQENNKRLKLSASTHQIESNWWLPLFTYTTEHKIRSWFTILLVLLWLPMSSKPPIQSIFWLTCCETWYKTCQLYQTLSVHCSWVY